MDLDYFEALRVEYPHFDSEYCRDCELFGHCKAFSDKDRPDSEFFVEGVD